MKKRSKEDQAKLDRTMGVMGMDSQGGGVGTQGVVMASVLNTAAGGRAKLAPTPCGLAIPVSAGGLLL
jgi:hypothetical protein